MRAFFKMLGAMGGTLLVLMVLGELTEWPVSATTYAIMIAAVALFEIYEMQYRERSHDRS